MSKWNLSQECEGNSSKENQSIKRIPYSQNKGKIYALTSIDAKTAFDKVHHTLHDNTSRKLEYKELPKRDQGDL